jgi:hypothetical protein
VFKRAVRAADAWVVTGSQTGDPSHLQTVSVGVDRWTVRVRRVPPVLSLLGAAILGGFGWVIGFRWWAIGLALLVSLVLNLQNRYIVVEAELGETLQVRYLGGRARTLQPHDVRIARSSPWRICFYGGFPLVARRGWRCVGGFYPTLDWHDLNALDRWLDTAGAPA